MSEGQGMGSDHWPSWLPRPVRLMDGWGLVRQVRAGDGSRVRVLQTGGVYQSATYLDERRMEPVFSYYRAFDHAFSVRPDTRRVLMVGGGGYAWPKHVLATRPAEVTLDVVELDPEVTRAARRWFFVGEACGRWPGCLHSIEGDGRAFLETRARELAAADACAQSVARYDAIVLDAFSGSEPVRALATVEAARAARACLVLDGLVLMNVVSEDAGGDVSFLRSVVATFAEAFAHVYVVPCDDDPFAVEDNYLVIATNAPWQVSDALPYDEDFLGEVLRD